MHEDSAVVPKTKREDGLEQVAAFPPLKAQGEEHPAALVFSSFNGTRYLFDSATSTLHPWPWGVEGPALDCLYATPDGDLPAFTDSIGAPPALARYVRLWRDQAGAFGRYLMADSPSVAPKQAPVVQGVWPSLMANLILVVTDACNLRCRYCILGGTYEGFKPLREQAMSWETAKAAIDHFIALNRGPAFEAMPGRKINISFFGGEPMLRGDLIQQAVAYAKAQQRPECGYWIDFGLTSNLTHLPDKLAAFLAKHEVGVQVSLDGPAEEHDACRVNAAGRGSFARVRRNLQKLRTLDPAYFERCVRSVVTINGNSDLRALHEFFESGDPLVPRISFVGLVRDLERSEYHRRYPFDSGRLWGQYAQLMDEYRRRKRAGIPIGKGEFLYRLFEDGLHALRGRLMHAGARKQPAYTGTCMPGRRLAVSTDGRFHMCERINEKFPIGDVHTGVDWPRCRSAAALLRCAAELRQLLGQADLRNLYGQQLPGRCVRVRRPVQTPARRTRASPCTVLHGARREPGGARRRRRTCRRNLLPGAGLVNQLAAARSHFAFFPHAQLVRGQVGAAVHDLFLGRLFWIRDGAAADALARMAAGADADAAADAAALPRETLDQYLAALAALDLGTIVPTRTAHHIFRPLFSPMQAREMGVFRPHGRVTVELANACVFDCPWCTSLNTLTPLACHCGVWPARGPRLHPDERAAVIARLAEQGVTSIVVRGGEPLLQWDDLLALLRIASALHLHCEIHSTGVGLTEDRVAALKEHDAHMVLLFASPDDAEFDQLVRRRGAGMALRHAVFMLRRAGVPFSAKVPVSIRAEERGGVLTEWAIASGAKRVEQIDYGLERDGCALEELREKTGPASPQRMGVGTQDFFANVECQNCFANACCVAADGRLQLCIAARNALADLTREPITQVLREDRISAARAGTARADIPACGRCEFRYGCQACLVRSGSQVNGEYGRHWNCAYDPARSDLAVKATSNSCF